MLKEIDRDESHSRKQKIFFITPLMAYKKLRHYNETLFRRFSQYCAHAPPFFCFIHQSFKRKNKLFVFRESEAVRLPRTLRLQTHCRYKYEIFHVLFMIFKKATRL
jgi:hypothetical protein